MESLIMDHTMDYFMCNNLFSDSQYGFIRRDQVHYRYLNYSTIGKCIQRREGKRMWVDTAK